MQKRNFFLRKVNFNSYLQVFVDISSVSVSGIIVHGEWMSMYGMCGKVEASDERIDVERLKVRDKIGFYSDVILFEDELHDNGCSVLSVKIVCQMLLTCLI